MNDVTLPSISNDQPGSTTGTGTNKKRRSHKKSRSGCLTCRARRIKCDEIKPKCGGCARNSLTCGYVVHNTKMLARDRHLVAIMPRTKSKLPDSTPLSQVSKHAQQLLPYIFNDNLVADPRHPLSDNAIDAQYFRFFWDSTSHKLSGFFDDKVWTILVLQACHEEEFARYAVIAIAALHKVTDLGHDDDENLQRQRTMHHNFALMRYAKALTLVQHIINQLDQIESDAHQLQRALIASLLITCFEFFHGNRPAGLSQISTAVKLSTSIRAKHNDYHSIAVTNTGNTIIDKDLWSAFARLERDAMIVTRQQLLPDSQDYDYEARNLLSAMPKKFVSLSDARSYCDVMLRFSSGWRAKYGYPVSHEAITAEDKSLKENLLQSLEMDDEKSRHNGHKSVKQRKLIEAALHSEREVLSRFDGAFLPLYNTIRKLPRQSKDYQGATTIMILYMATELTRETALQSRSTYQPDTKAFEMIKLIKDVLGYNEAAHPSAHSNTSTISRPTAAIEILTQSSSTLQPQQREQKLTEDATRPSTHSFIFDSSIVHPLYIAATRSHDREVRAEATRVLRACRRREGITDSDVAACIAENLAVVDVAEDDLEVRRDEGSREGRSDKGGCDRRQAKLMLVEEEFDVKERKIWFRCKRIGAGRSGILPRASWKW